MTLSQFREAEYHYNSYWLALIQVCLSKVATAMWSLIVQKLLLTVGVAPTSFAFLNGYG
jgi:hypothetical protein